MFGKIGSCLRYSYPVSAYQTKCSTHLLLSILDGDKFLYMVTNYGLYKIVRKYANAISKLYFCDRYTEQLLEGPIDVAFDPSLSNRYSSSKLVLNW